MSDSPPRLNVAAPDPLNQYAPISWLAVLSCGIAGLFVLLVLALGYGAWDKKLPLVEPWLLSVAFLGLVTVFAARKHISNSEGTQSGLWWANLAWWVCVVGGVSYLTYLFTIDWTIRSDAEKAFMAWTEPLKKADPAKLDDPEFLKASFLVIPVDLRAIAGSDFAKLGPTEIANISSKFGSSPELLTFRNNELFPILRRNEGKCEFVTQGLKNWKQNSGKIECELSVLLKTPEGEYPLSVPMQANVDKQTSRRQWQILRAENYYQPNMEPARLTNYGWSVLQLQDSARQTANDFLTAANGRNQRQPLVGNRKFSTPGTQLAQRVAYEMFMTDKLPRATGDQIIDSTFYRTAVVGSFGLFWSSQPGYTDAFNGPALTGLGGAPLSEEQRRKFKFVWESQHEARLMLAGSSGLVGFPDKHIFLSIKPDRIEAQVPLEVKPSDATDNFSAARGRIILELQNPANVQEINAAREASVGAIVPRPNQQTAPYQWRVVRIESDLVVKQYKPNNNSGPGGM